MLHCPNPENAKVGISNLKKRPGFHGSTVIPSHWMQVMGAIDA